jgi:hypothetical protein
VTGIQDSGSQPTTGNGRDPIGPDERGPPPSTGAVLLPTDNEWGVPVLRLDRQATALDLPFVRWGREKRKSRMRGTWHFYTEDYRFSRLWERPQDLVNSGCVAAVEPNWSVHEQTPRAAALWQTYRKRYLARLWQDWGVRTLVDLNVASEHATTNLLGVPKGWRAFATRGSVERLVDVDVELEAAQTVAGTRDVLFVVYGGGKAVQARCLERGLLWFAEAQDEERNRGA